MFRLLDLVGIRYMSMAMLQGNLSRLQTSVDIITPFLLLFVLQAKRLNLGLSKRFIYLYRLFQYRPFSFKLFEIPLWCSRGERDFILVYS